MAITREQYIIMDEKRLFVVQHSASQFKTKYLTHVDQIDNPREKIALRIFYYDQIGHAKRGLDSYFTWLEDMLHYYPEIMENAKLPHKNDLDRYAREYKKQVIDVLKSKLQVVKVRVRIEEI
ncbi:MAG: hypothetical protein E6R13_00585 [Spirochaetes bacterium]|nr:MAG: hypothetical protein E6R13_00585 [Spirochaetota bacterium]